MVMFRDRRVGIWGFWGEARLIVYGRGHGLCGREIQQEQYRLPIGLGIFLIIVAVILAYFYKTGRKAEKK